MVDVTLDGLPDLVFVNDVGGARVLVNAGNTAVAPAEFQAVPVPWPTALRYLPSSFHPSDCALYEFRY